MGRCNLLATVCALALLGPAACGTSGGVGRGVARTGPTASAPAAATVPAASTPASSPAPTRSARRESGWTATVYYTAVQRFHTGPATRVTGCPVLDCRRGGADLGSYPGDFVKAVRDEGTGRTTAGRYLNWSSDVGFWLDDAPRNGHGGALVPFTSAAADADVLAAGAPPTGASTTSSRRGSAGHGTSISTSARRPGRASPTAPGTRRCTVRRSSSPEPLPARIPIHPCFGHRVRLETPMSEGANAKMGSRTR